MSGYTEAAVIEKLNKLNESTESIQTLSQWMMYHKKYAKETTRIWAEQIQKVSLQRKLQFLYVANDVVQLNRRKDGEFVKEFSLVLPDSVSHVYRHGDDGIRKAIVRLLDIWLERKVYSPLFINEIKLRLGISSTSQGSNPPGPPSQKIDPIQHAIESKKNAKIAEHLQLIGDLGAKVNQNVSKDLALGNQATMIPREFLDPNFTTKIKDKDSALDELKRVSDQVILLDQYEVRLTADLEDRSALIANLKKMVAEQEAIVKASQPQLEDCKKKVAQMMDLKKNLKTISDSLPSIPSSRPRMKDRSDSFDSQGIPSGPSHPTYYQQQPPPSHPYPSNWAPQQPYSLHQVQPIPQQPAQGLGPGPSSSSGQGPY